MFIERRAPGLRLSGASIRSIVLEAAKRCKRKNERFERRLQALERNYCPYEARLIHLEMDVEDHADHETMGTISRLLRRINEGEDLGLHADDLENGRRNSYPAIKPALRAMPGGPRILGLAAVFYDGTPRTEYMLGRGIIERVAPTAFDRALAEKQDVRGLFNHDANHLLGRTSSRTMALTKTKQGLAYEISPGASAIARDVVSFLQRGDLSGSSFSFAIVAEDWKEEGPLIIRTILDVDLFDVSAVSYPSYHATSATFMGGSESFGMRFGPRPASRPRPASKPAAPRQPLSIDAAHDVALARVRILELEAAL